MPNPDQYIIQSSTLTGIADAVREMRMHDQRMAPEDMPDEIKAIKTGVSIDIDTTVRGDDPEWTRPVGWPDLDSIEIPNDFDGVYMTYDLSKTRGYGWIGVYVNTKTTGAYYVERGHLENGTFVTDYSVKKTNNSYFREPLDENNGMVQLWRVWSEKKITRFGLVPNDSNTTYCMQNNMQPMVERRGIFPYVTNLSSSISANQSHKCMGTIWLERDNFHPGTGVVTSMSGMYDGCYRLEKVALDWDTSLWAVTSLSGCFRNCYRIKNLDFSTWNTSNWAVTTMTEMFYYCASLKSIDLSMWDTENWAITNFNSVFYVCESTEEIDLSGWDTSNWAVTLFTSVFGYCRNLRRIIGIESFNTSGWAVQSLNYLFTNALSIEELDLSGWDTSGWAVTSFANTFYNCYRLKKLDMSTWDTSNWTITNMSGTFYYCRSLVSLDLSHWNTSGWAVTSLSDCWQSCYNLETLIVPFDTSNWPVTGTGFKYTFNNVLSLKRLDLSSWDTSGWTITDIRQEFANDHSLEEITGIGDWDVSNWRIQYIQSMFSQCHSLKNLDLSDWDTSDWVVTDCSSMFQNCMRLENAGGILEWDTSNWPTTTIGFIFSGTMSARQLDLSDWDLSSFTLTGVYNIVTDNVNLEELTFPSAMDLTGATNVNYTIPVNNGCAIKECNFYTVKGANMNISQWVSLSRESLLTLIGKLQQTSTTRTLTLGKVGQLKLTAEEIAVATQKGWTVA